MSEPFRVVLFGHNQCCLCEAAETMLRGLQNEYSFVLEKVDIRADDELYQKMRCHIPIITIDGGNRVALRITTERLRRAFRRALERKSF